MKLKPTFLIAIGICMLAYTAIGQTVLSGTYNENFFMTKANSPYFVKDSAIFNCDELSIQPGVIVTFKYLPDPEKKTYIRINGDVRADMVGGTDPIIFT